MTTTPNLGLTIFSEASGSAITHSTFRNAIAGTSSNMTVIDNFAGETSSSILDLKANTIPNVPASYISSNYYEANVSTITSYITNMIISLKLNVTITGSTTINISELGVITLKKINAEGNLSNLSSGDLKQNRNYLFKYDGTYFVLIGDNIADQISISGTPSNFVSISASNVLQDSGVPILSGVTTGSYNKVEIDQYGRVTTGSQIAYQTTSSISGSGVMSNTTGSEVRHNTSGVTSGSYNKIQVDAYGHITGGSQIAYQTVSSISGSSVMSNTTGSEVRHNYSGITSGSYSKIQVDAFGHVTSGSQATGISGSRTFYSASATGGSVANILNTIAFVDGLITSWTQA
jgi:hypothetical protein